MQASFCNCLTLKQKSQMVQEMSRSNETEIDSLYVVSFVFSYKLSSISFVFASVACLKRKLEPTNNLI